MHASRDGGLALLNNQLPRRRNCQRSALNSGFPTMTIDLDTTIQRFLEIAFDLQTESALTAEAVLQRVVQDYRDVRIDGASIDADGDMLLLQWGVILPLVTGNPLDMRNASDDDTAFE